MRPRLWRRSVLDVLGADVAGLHHLVHGVGGRRLADSPKSSTRKVRRTISRLTDRLPAARILRYCTPGGPRPMSMGGRSPALARGFLASTTAGWAGSSMSLLVSQQRAWVATILGPRNTETA